MWTAARARRHLNRGVLLRAAVVPAWAAASIFGVYRLAIGPWSLVVGLAALLIAAGVAAWRFRRHAWSNDEAAVVLDRAAGAGGLLLALAERPDPRWQQQLAPKLVDVSLPRDPLGRPALALAGALAFAAITGALPEARPPVRPLQSAAASRVDALDHQAEPLAQEQVLPETLAEELARLREEARTGSFDAADWEASDVVESALSDAAAARESALAEAEAAARELEQALEKAADAEAVARARDALEEALAQLSEQSRRAEGGEPSQAAAEASEAAAAQAELVQTAADARTMAEALEARRQALERAFERQQGMAKGPRGEPGDGGPGQGQGEGDQGEGSGGQSGSEQGEAMGEGDGASEPGIGAPTRGGGIAPVTFGEEVKVQADRLRLEALPPGEDDVADQLLGIERHAPQTPESYSPTAPGAAGDGADGVGPNRTPVPPRHRELLRRYFDPGGK